MGLIEEVQAMDYALNDGRFVEKINNLLYLSSDISDMMLRGSLLHPNVKFEVSDVPTVSELMDVQKK